VFLLERQAAYIRQALEYKERNRLAWLEVSDATYQEFQSWLEHKLDRTVFTDNCPGWYTNDQGKVTAMWPASHLAYARATRRFEPDQFSGWAAAQPVSASNLPAHQPEVAR
jgi:hypothetical protein